MAVTEQDSDNKDDAKQTSDEITEKVNNFMDEFSAKLAAFEKTKPSSKQTQKEEKTTLEKILETPQEEIKLLTEKEERDLRVYSAFFSEKNIRPGKPLQRHVINKLSQFIVSDSDLDTMVSEGKLFSDINKNLKINYGVLNWGESHTNYVLYDHLEEIQALLEEDTNSIITIYARDIVAFCEYEKDAKTVIEEIKLRLSKANITCEVASYKDVFGEPEKPQIFPKQIVTSEITERKTIDSVVGESPNQTEDKAEFVFYEASELRKQIKAITKKVSSESPGSQIPVFLEKIDALLLSEKYSDFKALEMYLFDNLKTDGSWGDRKVRKKVNNCINKLAKTYGFKLVQDVDSFLESRGPMPEEVREGLRAKTIDSVVGDAQTEQKVTLDFVGYERSELRQKIQHIKSNAKDKGVSPLPLSAFLEQLDDVLLKINSADYENFSQIKPRLFAAIKIKNPNLSDAEIARLISSKCCQLITNKNFSISKEVVIFLKTSSDSKGQTQLPAYTPEKVPEPKQQVIEPQKPTVCLETFDLEAALERLESANKTLISAGELYSKAMREAEVARNEVVLAMGYNFLTNKKPDLESNLQSVSPITSDKINIIAEKDIHTEIYWKAAITVSKRYGSAEISTRAVNAEYYAICSEICVTPKVNNALQRCRDKLADKLSAYSDSGVRANKVRIEDPTTLTELEPYLKNKSDKKKK